jgi:acyl-CoA reductase-like NAD-dependent aldehyde dehydrogenase
MSVPSKIEHFIGGRQVPSADGATFDVADPDVPLISFTGETTTGKIIMKSAADNLKGLSMELGGKSPCVIFADADLDAAIDSALFGVFSLNGERCTAGSRILAERPVYDEVVARLAKRAARVRVGDPSDPVTEVGALVHPEHYARVLDYVDIGVKEGARLVAGGSRPADLPAGNYLAATVFADVEPSMRVFQEEIFGPVVAVTPFDTEEEAIGLANGTRYGLAAYLWTSNLNRAHRVAAAVESGMTWINSHNVRDLRTPFGFLIDFFDRSEHPERLQQRYDLRRGAEVARFDHFNICVPNVPRACDYYSGLGFGLSETIEDGQTPHSFCTRAISRIPSRSSSAAWPSSPDARAC